jgi:hypothetical protein
MGKTKLYDYDELFPGRFLKSGEFKGRDVTLKVRDVDIEDLPDKKGTKVNEDGERVRVRGIISFEKTDKQLVLNRTNGECLKAMFGRNPNDWIGKRVTFFPAVVDAFGEETTAIRVRGSPDLEKDVRFELKLPQKTAKAVTLKKTGQAPAAANGNSRPPAEAPPAAPPAESNGELPLDPPATSDEQLDDFERGFLPNQT